MAIFTNKEKEVVGILSFGTFLEYFDLYLYIHLAVTLNKVFFAEGDAQSSALLTSFAYMMSFIFRPLSAIILGYVGDKYGRVTVIKTTLFLMGIVCLGIFFLPSYQEIGIMASFGITFLRILQGFSTMGEIIGGEIYLSEFLKGKKTFLGIATINFTALIACQFALAGVYLSLKGYFDWRYLFLFGLVIFIIGFRIRQKLMESNEFLENKVARIPITKEKLSKKFCFLMFLMECMSTVAAYVSLIGFNNILRQEYGYTELDVTARNMSVTLFHMLAFVICFLMFIYTKFSPYIIALSRNILGILFILTTPFLLNDLNSIIFAQSALALLCCLDSCLINAIIYKNLPIGVRFKVGAITFAFAKALTVILVSFGLVLMKPYLGNYTILFFTLPFLIGYNIGLRYFAKIDKKNPNGLLQHYDN